MLFCQQEFKIALFKQTDCHLDLKVQYFILKSRFYPILLKFVKSKSTL